jgi:lipopolysaccharide export system permease protein
MLFHSTLRKDLARSFWTSWVVLFTIVMTLMLIRTLGLASQGELDPESLSLALGYSALGRMPLILSVALYIAVVSTMTRLYRDSEMPIWLGSGVGLLRFLRPSFRFAWPILLAIAALQLWAWPWHNAELDVLKDRYEARNNVDRVAPGQFRESASGDVVFFMDKTSQSGQAGNGIFITSKTSRGHLVTSAEHAQMVSKADGQFMELINGEQTRRNPIDQTQTITRFERQGTLISDPIVLGGGQALKSTPTLDLFKNFHPGAQGEFAWRIGMFFMASNFVLMALAIANANNRGKRGLQTGMALLSAVIYFNLHTVSSSWVAYQKVSLIPMLFILHGGVMLVCGLWLLKRHRQIEFWPQLKSFLQKKPALGVKP